jgi:uncharacterized protein (DUF433 family)
VLLLHDPRAKRLALTADAPVLDDQGAPSERPGLGAHPTLGMWHTGTQVLLKYLERGMTDNTSTLITSDPEILGGKPVIAGTRISVQLILEKLGDGWSIQDLLADYPHLTRDQIIAAIVYAASVLGMPRAS